MSDLEARLTVIEHQLADLLELVNSGPRVPWDQSLRGKVHKLVTEQASTAMLEQAARELRRAQHRQWSRLEKAALFVFAATTALAPWVAIALHAAG